MMNNAYSIDALNNHMSLRLPQYKSLAILDDLMKSLNFQDDNTAMQKAIHEKYPIFREFERAFPSLTFALATGVGKTMLMAAFITYLYTNHDIKNYFIIAPNLTVYNKLIKDFGSPDFKKYVFKGINIFGQNPPLIITGDTYKNIIAGQQSLYGSITINIFNIGKINAEVRGNNVPQVKRLSEYIGESYFDYLSGLHDLVLLMDESHHYRADRGMTVINELDPILGLELTATPQIETSKGAIKFKNVVYEYSLAKAINDGFVKEPAAATRKDFDSRKFNPDEIDRIKLTDGIRIHRNTKAELEAYAQNEETRLVKPFVLVVCKDTTHAAEIKEYITSEEFFDGYYSDKVIELHSNQKGGEKDENIQRLLSLEDKHNIIEIVIHVNMLKEGWDVTNLYTIIPLRTATSLTLREQTIGRGLRLPYGKRTGNKEVDRLTIVAHDKFEEIISAANDERSIIKQENIIVIEDDEDSEKEKEVVKPPTTFGSLIEEKEKKLKYARSDEKKKEIREEIETAKAVGLAIDEILSKPVNISVPVVKSESENKDTPSEPAKAAEIVKKVITSRDLSKPEVIELIKEKAARNLEKSDGQLMLDMEDVEKKIELAIAPMIEQKVNFTIDIPDIAVVQTNIQVKVYSDFDLDTRFWGDLKPPKDEILIESLKDNDVTTLESDTSLVLPDTEQNIILFELLNLDTSIDFALYEDLLYKLVNQALDFIGKNKSDAEREQIVYHHKKYLAWQIREQLKTHSSLTEPQYEVKLLRASAPILQQDYTKFKEDEIVKFTENIPAYEIKKKVVGQFKKACHTAYKFDSVPEHIFSIVLERNNKVLKWLRPAPQQFKIHWNGSHVYVPDFVVETTDYIYIAEIKAYNRVKDDEVQLKAKAAREYCKNVNTLYAGTGKKEWRYMLLIDGDIARSTDFAYLEKEIAEYSFG